MKRKQIAAIGVVILLVGFPIISYLYLRSGYIYRLETLEDIREKERFETLLSCNTTMDTTTVVLEGNTSLLSWVRSAELDSNLDALDEQMKDTELFRSYRFYDGKNRSFISVEQDGKYCVLSNEELIEVFDENTMLLIDSNAMIRHYYGDDEASFKKMVEHIAFILPKEKRKNISVKREPER